MKNLKEDDPGAYRKAKQEELATLTPGSIKAMMRNIFLEIRSLTMLSKTLPLLQTDQGDWNGDWGSSGAGNVEGSHQKASSSGKT